MSEVGGHSTRRLEHDLSVDRVRRLIVQRLSDGSSAGGPLDTRRLRVEFPGYESLIAAELAAREDVRHPGTILDEGTTDEGWPGTEPRQSEMAAGRSIGRYIVERTLGRGGMGVVYLARDPALDRTVVLKMVRPDQVDAEMVSRLESEARALARLNHPAICPIYDIVKEGSDKVGVVLPFIPGLPLRCQGAVDAYISFGTTRLLRESSSRANGEGAMTPSGVAKVKKTPIADATRLLERVARAVGTAHDVGLVHRDLKPDNIMIRPDGEPVIMDFGLASAPCGMPIEGSGSRSGTPAYMAPEQVRGTGPFDARTDVYALGVVLYEHLTGCRPFSSTSGREDLFAQILAGRPTPPRALRRDIPDDLEAVCLKAMDVRRESRFPSTREFEEELRRFRTGRSTRTAPVGLARIATRKARRHPVAALAVAAILVAMLLVAYSWQQRRRTGDALRLAQAKLMFDGFLEPTGGGRRVLTGDELAAIRELAGDDPDIERLIANPLDETTHRRIRDRVMDADRSGRSAFLVLEPRGRVTVERLRFLVSSPTGFRPEEPVALSLIAGATFERRDLPVTVQPIAGTNLAYLKPRETLALEEGTYTVVLQRPGGGRSPATSALDSDTVFEIGSGRDRDEVLATVKATDQTATTSILRALALQSGGYRLDALLELDGLDASEHPAFQARLHLLRAVLENGLGRGHRARLELEQAEKFSPVPEPQR